ncbi:MAG: hypothetical protein QF793_04375 [Candidatus Peribacteraceae bacterium]|jgi:hypothetical protein|nr:hypothetical protein [bacterium]MDP6562130.1 hypothetical protein [Candidatus Peribacteraceae bacterium]|tara:strand:- start:2741 stop:2950 length:210 start_codon:yes stop_codon:yes gene_type:complete
MSLAQTLLKQSAEEKAGAIRGGNPGSPTETTREIILNYKLQQKLIRQTFLLVVATWVLSIVTIAVVIIK